jgi:3-methyladenine DNA glycosylase AlkD
LQPKANARSRAAAALPTRRRVERELAAVASRKRAKGLAWFFKTGKGEYGEGDRFLGITVPEQRKIALRHIELPLDEVARLLHSPIHEHRFTALEILVAKYARADEPNRSRIFAFYIRHAECANNWDLVDTSAPYIVGVHLKKRPRELLDRLAASRNLWKRRIAIVSTLTLIRDGQIDDTFRIARKLLRDQHDLIHKAAGWMLREAGKVSRPALLNFLRNHYSAVPRTTLRYAIERLPQAQRRQILAGKVR